MISPWTRPDLDRLLAMRQALPHALLVHGPDGVGKAQLARHFAGAMLCESPLPDGDACGKCVACGWFAQSNHPDFRLLVPEADEEGGEGRAGRAEGKKASRAIRIQQIRALSEFLAVGGHRGGRKIVLITPADALNVPAANALLKTLEEPPGNTVFLLVTGHADALPATIRSRCVAVGVPLPAPEVALDWLAGQEGVEPGGAPALLAAVGGAPLRALSLAEPAEAAAHRAVLQALAELPDTTVIRAADTVAAHPPRMWLPLLLAWVSDLGRVLAGAQARRFPDRADRLARLARGTSLARVANYAAWLQHQQAVAEHPLNPRLLCEDTLLRYGALFPAESKAKN
jgi:DNA polymerase-3 subunit delta'